MGWAGLDKIRFQQFTSENKESLRDKGRPWLDVWVNVLPWPRMLPRSPQAARTQVGLHMGPGGWRHHGLSSAWGQSCNRLSLLLAALMLWQQGKQNREGQEGHLQEQSDSGCSRQPQCSKRGTLSGEKRGQDWDGEYNFFFAFLIENTSKLNPQHFWKFRWCNFWSSFETFKGLSYWESSLPH